jgi:thiosulfate dehydrogenase [quinone] large subunit
MSKADYVLMEKNEIGLRILAVFRILLGWIMLWPFFDKLLGLGFSTPAGQGVIDGGSPSSFVIYVTDGLLKDFYTSIAGNGIVDVIMMLGLLVLGITLITGIAAKLTTIGMTAFLLIMWSLVLPPTDNPVIDHRIILAVGLIATYFLGGFERYSLHGWWKETWLVKRFPIFE